MVLEERSLKDCSFLEELSWRGEHEHHIAPKSKVRLKYSPENTSLQVEWTQKSKFQGDVFVLTTVKAQDGTVSHHASCTLAELQLPRSIDVRKLTTFKRKVVIALVQNVTSYLLDIGHREGGSVVATQLILQLPKLMQTWYCKSKRRSNSLFSDLIIPVGVNILENRAEISITPPVSSPLSSKVEVHLTLVTWVFNEELQSDSELCKNLNSEMCYESSSEEEISFNEKSTNPVMINLNKDNVYQLLVDYVLLENGFEETCRVTVKSPKFSLNSTGKSFVNVSGTVHFSHAGTTPVVADVDHHGDGSVNETLFTLPNQAQISDKVMADTGESDPGDRIKVIMGITAGSLAALLAITMSVAICVYFKGTGYLRALRDEKTNVSLPSQPSSSNRRIFNDNLFHSWHTPTDNRWSSGPPEDSNDSALDTLLGNHHSLQNIERFSPRRHSKGTSSDLSTSFSDELGSNALNAQYRGAYNSTESMNKRTRENPGSNFTLNTNDHVMPSRGGGNNTEDVAVGDQSFRVSGVSQSWMSLEDVGYVDGDEIFASSIGESLLWSKRNLIGDMIVPPNSDTMSLTLDELDDAFDVINEAYNKIIGAGDYYNCTRTLSQLWECATVCEESAC